MPRRSPQLLSALMAATLMALVAAAFITGCTSDDSNIVGVDLGTVELDTLMREIVVENLVHLGQLEVYDPSEPLDAANVLYLGEEYGDASSILVNYDFSILEHPDSMAVAEALTADNVTKVELRVITLQWYAPNHGAGVDEDEDGEDDVEEDEELRDYDGAFKVFDVHLLDAPFDTLSVPREEPSFDPTPVSVAVEIPDPELRLRGGELSIELDKDMVMQWVTDRAQVGLIIREGVGSEPGLQGFASKEMTFGGSTLPTLSATTTLGVGLRIRFENSPDTRDWYIQEAEADASTWHQVTESPLDAAQGIEVRGHLRSYPVLNFDPGVMPEGIRINLAQLVLHADPSQTYGPDNYLTISEFPLSMAPDGTRTSVILDDIEGAAELIGGGTVKPEHASDHVVRLNVTTALQRYINELQDESLGFLISRGEGFFSGFVASPGPGFWASRWSFYGTDADPDLRPRLEIVYTRVDNLSDGEVQ